MTHFRTVRVSLALMLIVGGCGDDDTTEDASVDALVESDATVDTATDVDSTGGNPTIADLFDESLFSTPPELVDCTLDNGDASQCYKLSFANYQDSTGPFCPDTVEDIGGIGIYDGPTNPGLQLLARPLWEAMETDGFDILDDEGNVRQNAGMGTASCLNMALQDLTVTFLIPANPQLSDSNNEIDVVELFGVAIEDGMPLTGQPPSVVDGPPMPGAVGGGIPSLDPCGGHADPAGYWHWHFTPNNTQSVLDAFDITEVGCSDIPQLSSGLVGFAKDGFPIYSPLDGGEVPSDLDECSGKFGITSDYPDGIYHYYAVNETAPNLPTCIKGASVQGRGGFIIE